MRRITDVYIWRDSYDGHTALATIWRELPNGGWEGTGRRLTPRQILRLHRQRCRVVFMGPRTRKFTNIESVTLENDGK